MAKDGYRIFDSDTHVGPAADLLQEYLPAPERRRLEAWDEFKTVDKLTGHFEYTRGRRNFPRVLGTAEVDFKRPRTAVRKHHDERDMPLPQAETDPSDRIRDMDREGVDVNLTLPSSWFGTFIVGDDVALEAAMYRAYHRWMKDYCGTYPDRIKGVVLACARDVPGSLEEIERCSQEDWPLACMVYAPSGFPLDHPDLEPIWAACQHHDFSIALHTFTAMPPYAPGSLDTWNNYFLQRSVAHSWCGELSTAALICAGIMDRYPELRIAPLEAGHGWLPFWMARMDEHAKSHVNYISPLERKPSEYIRSGRYFQSIEMSEGEALTKAVIDLIGDDILMFASDYPHRESWFPKSVETVMAWDLPQPTKRKLFWDNAVKFYARYQPQAA